MHYNEYGKIYLYPHIILKLSVSFLCNQKFCNILIVIDGCNHERCVPELHIQTWNECVRASHIA